MNTTATTPDVSILIVAYNSQAIIAACLGSIPAACTRHTYEVLLIDNGDGASEALVSAKFPAAKIVRSRGNVGFAAGNNLLAAQARAPLFLLANPDLELTPGAIDALLDAARRYPAAAAWGGVTLDRTGHPDIGNSVHIPSLHEMASRLIGRSVSRLNRGDALLQDQRVEALSGGFVMFSRAAWDAAGGLDDRYFLYCEEVDLFYRLSAMGCEFWRIGSARAFHDAGHGNNFSQMRLLYRAAGIMQFAKLHWSYPNQMLGFILLWLSALQRYIFGEIFSFWNPHLRQISYGYRRMAFSPREWRHGYHPTKGLLAKLNQRKT